MRILMLFCFSVSLALAAPKTHGPKKPHKHPDLIAKAGKGIGKTAYKGFRVIF